jgi:hypothetical protein
MKHMKYLQIKILTLGFLVLFGMQLSAQMIPQSYFEPKAGGSPKSDFYTIFSYNVGLVYGDQDLETEHDSPVGMEGMSALFFFPSKSGRTSTSMVSSLAAAAGKTKVSKKTGGIVLGFNYNKMIQDTYIYSESKGNAPILSKNLEVLFKSVGQGAWSAGLFYQRRGYELGGENYFFNGLGFEFSIGGYPALNYEKGNWPVSFKGGTVLHIESFDQESPGVSFYSELALERIRKRQGVSLYASLYSRFQYDSYRFMAEDAEEFDNPVFEFDTYYLIPGFRVGVMF